VVPQKRHGVRSPEVWQKTFGERHPPVGEAQRANQPGAPHATERVRSKKKDAFEAFKKELYRNKLPEDVILHVDESGFAFCGTLKKYLMRKGSQPRLPSPGGNKRVNIVGVVDPFSGWTFFQYIKPFDAVTFLVFLVCIIAQFLGPGKIYLLLDNCRAHHAG